MPSYFHPQHALLLERNGLMGYEMLNAHNEQKKQQDQLQLMENRIRKLQIEDARTRKRILDNEKRQTDLKKVQMRK
jgi:glycerol-3-phosphate cytidylyltransferase-like family protein